ncbi:glutaredoxin 3 [Roseibium sp. HPY-6]|uniref:glutaredoxin 3 n=1 Tax=Roseibium sp. HPY-6 TaxID=3229852 RepID=UPI00338F4E7D
MADAHNTTNPLILPDDLPRPVDDGGADHLTGMKMPAVRLRATSGDWVDLSKLPGRVIIYAYPMTGVPGVELPPGWNDIPGARGCTPQTLSFQAEKDAFAAFGVTVFGLSTQTEAYQKELSDRLDLSFPILSDADFELTDAMRLPTMVVEGMRLIKRLTLVIKNGAIEHVFYPVFPPNRSAAEVIAWLQENAADAHGPGVLIYTTSDCPHCRAAKALLEQKGLSFVEVDVERDPEAANVMVARSNGRRTVPQIFLGSTHIGGGDELVALAKSGRLDTMLAGTTE